jgi:hypothetical protein
MKSSIPVVGIRKKNASQAGKNKVCWVNHEEFWVAYRVGPYLQDYFS